MWKDNTPQSRSSDRKGVVTQCLIALAAGFCYTRHNCFMTMSESLSELDVDIIWALAMQDFPHVHDQIPLSSSLQ